ncbi:hypothetical protein ACQPZA_23885 [Pseudonocardia xinjiangensis]|uniref:hypothetical protein n=1 Tax=Pseudonocardia xinjiangensis TaxID=75289 RepID=UPI003D8DDD77
MTIPVERPAHLTASFYWLRTISQDVKDDGVDRFRPTYLPADDGHHEPNEISRATRMIEINPVTSGSGRPLTSLVSADLVASVLTGAGAGQRERRWRRMADQLRGDDPPRPPSDRQ